MNKYLKEFFRRGLMFGGFGPIVAGIIYFVVSKTSPSFFLNGTEVFSAILSTYILAFLQAGATVFNQIENWSLMKSLLCHFSTLFVAYTSCYLLNSWIPFDYRVILIFIGIFVAVYFTVWSIVYFSIKATSRKLNMKL
jgi:hypothetical protein